MYGYFLERRKGFEILYELSKRNPGVLISSDEVLEWIDEISSSDSALRDQRDAELDDQELRNKVAEEVARGGLDGLRKIITAALEAEIKADPRVAFLSIYASRISRRLGLDISTGRVEIFLGRYVSQDVQVLREKALRGAAAVPKIDAAAIPNMVGAPQASQSTTAQKPPKVKGSDIRNVPKKEARKKYGAEVISFLNSSKENLNARFEDIAAHVNNTFGLAGKNRVSKGYVYNLYWGRASEELKRRRTEALAAKRLEQNKEEPCQQG